MVSKLEKMLRNVPPELKPRTNPVLNALLKGFAQEDQTILTQLQNTNAQLFVKTAEGTFLDRVASSLGVSRPAELGLSDENFQELIPNLSLKQKQVTRAFYDTMDVFWGPLFSRANITSGNYEPFNINVNDSFVLKVNNGDEQTVTVKAGDLKSPGFATADEVARILNRADGVTAEPIQDAVDNVVRVSLRTNTSGIRGSVEAVSGFADTAFPAGRFRITDLEQRTVLYQINPGEILIELPAIVPALNRSLKGSHHFHETTAIEPSVPPTNTVWQGSFIYSSTENPFVVTQHKTVLEDDPVLKGSVISQLTVEDTTGFPSEGGSLIFNFGKENEEQPVDFITVPNSKTLLIDPGYSFQNTHAVGSTVNLLSPGQSTAYSPRINGNDFAVYLTSPVSARNIVQEILKTLVAAGISVNFLILLPEYKYLITNPFSE